MTAASDPPSSQTCRPELAAIIFDMGDILYDASKWRRAMTARLQGLGVAIDFPQFVVRWEAQLVDVYKGRREYWDALAGLLASFPLSYEQVADMLAFGRAKAQEVEQRTPMEGVPTTLAALARHGLRLAVLSDTEAGEPKVRSILRGLEIEPHFHAVVTSRDIGFVKPEPQAFQAAIAAVGVPRDQCAFVGHDEDELVGAQAAGLWTIAYNYLPGVPADVYLEHFSELLCVCGVPAR